MSRLFKMLRWVPGATYINNKIVNLKLKTTLRAQRVWHNILRGGFAVFVLGFLVWLAVFIYMVFYYTYMPAIAHTRPVHLQFKMCDDRENLVCGFPTAHVELTRLQQILMVGQRYRINVELEMPESEANRLLGMFMVCIEMSAKDNTMVGHSCRSAVLHYRSPLLRTMQTFVYAPALVFGTAEEKQLVSVEVFSDFVDDSAHPVTDLYVEVQSRRIEVYSARVVIHAHFSGLRYLMFHWPILSAVVGVGLVLTTILFVLGLSWFHLAGDGPTARASLLLAERLRAFADEIDFHEDENETLEVQAKATPASSDDSDDESIEQLS